MSPAKRVCCALTAMGMVVAGACSSDDTTATAESTTTTSAATTNAGGTITIKDFAYDPKELTVETGEVVTWTNADGAKHTVTAEPGDPVEFKSETMQDGDSFAQTFSEPGTYAYFCSIHGRDRMAGTVVVQ
jgi:plastocyanin